MTRTEMAIVPFCLVLTVCTAIAVHSCSVLLRQETLDNQARNAKMLALCLKERGPYECEKEWGKP